MIFVLLPAYNEGKNITKVLEDIRTTFLNCELDYHVLAVNDGSTDNTLNLLESQKKQTNLEIISFSQNRGVDAVFKAGIEHICKDAQNDDILISMDCDQTHKAETFALLIKAIKGGSDIAIASRYHPKSKTVQLPLIRALLSDSINYMLRWIFPIKGAKDYTTFFRAYKIKILKKALTVYEKDFIMQKGFSCMSEILIKLRPFILDLKEVPIILRFDLRTGTSKMNIIRTVLGYLSLIFQELCSRTKFFFQKQDT